MNEIIIKNSIFPEEKELFSWDENALEAFKKLINEEGIKCRMDDIFLLGFLRAKSFDVEKSLDLLKNYYNIRVQYLQYFKDLLPSKLEHALSLNCIQFLPKPDQKGRYIMINQVGNWKTSISNAVDLFRASLLYFDFQLNFHRTQVNKIVCITNAEGFSTSHFFQVTPKLINGIVNILFKDSNQIQYDELHVVNINFIMKAVLKLFLPLLPREIKNMLHFHSGLGNLHEFISPECLPLELGGNLPSFDPTEANNMIKDNEEFFRINEEYLMMYKEEMGED
ncbi:alpha-tocopherol transfer protein-like [Centruroides sculpturatus]|uniref:alpha-tocopherol transfer protein-like n=1 Tax=Centruroides sculpturatus TaxID=218467 RepID=UPI000C6DD06C|nr:alpha-tocopherol transfer protein-like [Centruroides sculpturatus]XP_023232508.1 alpha-tocopherol transfer protein-like [Centruroides sculpturatus]XP_023232510.1 alpha-tocopherol transfer protein-like [Centruroides sculpturatus]